MSGHAIEPATPQMPLSALFYDITKNAVTNTTAKNNSEYFLLISGYSFWYVILKIVPSSYPPASCADWSPFLEAMFDYWGKELASETPVCSLTWPSLFCLLRDVKKPVASTPRFFLSRVLESDCALCSSIKMRILSLATFMMIMAWQKRVMATSSWPMSNIVIYSFFISW